MASAKPPSVEKTMIMSLDELKKARDAFVAKKSKSDSERSPDASNEKTMLASALEIGVTPDAITPEPTSQESSVEVAIDLHVGTADTVASIAPLPSRERPPVAESEPERTVAAPAREPASTTSLLEVFAPDVVLATSLDDAAEYDEEQEVHIKHAPLERGLPHGDMLVWRDGALIAAERFVKGVARERLMFHPDGTWAQFYLFDQHGLPRYRGRQKGPNGSPEEFPKGAEIHPKARQIEYLYDDHGAMEAFRCLDEYGDELSREVVSRAADMRTEQAQFDSLDEASARWRAEGDEFKGALNAWLAERYALVAQGEEADWANGEPSDTRGDMERVVVQAIEQYNAEGRFADLRADFPPAFEPFTAAFWERYAKPVNHVVSLEQGGVLISTSEGCFRAVDDTVTELEGVFAIGRCPNHRYVALARADMVEVTDGFDGPLVARLPYPTNYGWLSERFPGVSWPNLGAPEVMRIDRLLVTSDGRGVILVSAEGIHWLTPEDTRLLYPQPRQLKGYYENFKPLVQEDDASPSLDIDFAFAELSPDGSLLACGARLVRGVLAQLDVFRFDEGDWLPHVSSFEKSMFPRLLRFHDSLDQIGFAPVLYATVDTNWSDSMPNTVFRFSRSRLDNAGTLDEFDGGLRVAPGIVNSMQSWGDGFLLGMRNQGYLWHMSALENDRQLGFLHLGGSIDCIEASHDRQQLFVGTSCGQVICLRVSDALDPQLISDVPLVDEKRYLFWRSFSPMVW